jgi:DNA-binding NarL/FixJ family response regulator
VIVAEIASPYPDAEGIAWVRDTCVEFPNLRIVVFSMSGDRERINAALSAGAASYVVKDAPPGDLAAAVRQTFYHSIFLPGTAVDGGGPELGEPGGLTKREAEILRLAAEGMSNAQLARKLWVTEQTVKFHLSNTYRKLGVSNRTEAARWAQLNGLMPVSAGRSPAPALSLQAVGS